VEVYTKQPKVKLYLNNKLVDTKAVSRETQFKAVFKLPYETGELRAEAGGKSVTLATAGEPARLRLTADTPSLRGRAGVGPIITADGQDLAYITVEVVDKNGRVCPDAAIPCEAIVKGQGQLLAFASADLKDREPKTTSRATTWKGRALLVVRSNKSKGNVKVSIKSNLPTASLTIKTK
jgi:beta-galactosidase